ncbi:MAG TPA: UDP-N-acetylmuramoyl-tripeptide--D-alanyl-D-alanine ligase [Ktedonobacterales bacterium]|nr:UDP-N-acetylmuramoyl-tripeptide--D-alanyl-D-alanine ligase [Ktedonobacterales bacterium]
MFTRDELIAAAGVKPIGGVLPMRFVGGAVDSRQVRRGELFVALRGEQTDGHLYIGQAVRAGAAAILCARPSEEASARGVPQVVVPDPLDVLQRLGQLHLRAQRYTRVIAITGSNGKTSVKEATAALLEHIAPTLKTEGNLNTETGLPLTLLRLRPEHRLAVLEMGAQWVGEISMLCRIAPPDTAVVTVVGPEHLEFFGSLANVATAESEAVAALPPDGIAILNDDDRAVRKMAKRTRARVLTYGRRPAALVRAQRVSGDTLGGFRFTISYAGQRERVVLHVPGQHAITTALAAASVALSCGMTLHDAAVALGGIRPVKRRGVILPGVNGSTLIDDSYNANRQSALAAIDTLAGAKIPPGARRWFVFGDMLELGTYAQAEHAAVGTAAVGRVDELVLVGSEVQATAEAAVQAGMPDWRVRLFSASRANPAELAAVRQAAAAYLRAYVRLHDLVLVKGSMGVGMDAIVAELLERHDDKRSEAGTSEQVPLPANRNFANPAPNP